MALKTVMFYIFSSILVLAALRVVTVRNPVHAVLFLVLSFFTAAALWVLLGAEFLATVLVLVYIGAVMVLLLFAVMMLDIDLVKFREGFRRNIIVAIPIGLMITFEMAFVLTRQFWDATLTNSATLSDVGTAKVLGKVLYTEYIYAFEVVAAILLVAMVAAVALTFRRREDANYTDPYEALKVKREDRLRIVKMQAEPRIDAVDEGASEQEEEKE